MISRRGFLGRSVLTAATALVSRTFAQSLSQSAASPEPPKPQGLPNLDPSSLEKFVDPLPLPQLAKPLEHRLAPSASGERVPFYRVAMRAVSGKLHRDLPPTTLWSYGGSVPGLTFETRSGQGVLVEWANELPRTHFLPIDHTLHGAEKDKPEVRGVVHLHGGKTPPESDGYPEDWYVPGQSRTYYYPNRQDAAMLWYHDHAMGINRLNIYAGLLGLWVIRDSAEDALDLPKGKYEVPLVLMDRDLRSDGQLSYPVSADPARPWVPEVFGEAHLVNGKLFPYLDVEPRKYRFRILNGANGRFYWLSLSQGAEMLQIGSDQRTVACACRGEACSPGAGRARRSDRRFCAPSRSTGGSSKRSSHTHAVSRCGLARARLECCAGNAAPCASHSRIQRYQDSPSHPRRADEYGGRVHGNVVE